MPSYFFVSDSSGKTSAIWTFTVGVSGELPARQWFAGHNALPLEAVVVTYSDSDSLPSTDSEVS